MYSKLLFSILVITHEGESASFIVFYNGSGKITEAEVLLRLNNIIFTKEGTGEMW